MKLMPDQPVPALAVDTLAGKRFDVATQTPKNFTQIVFYRGMHCPICKNYLRSIDARLADFEGHGVETIAISMDSRERAQEAAKSWELQRLTIGYGLPEATARAWGLYLSRSIMPQEANHLFTEPGLFLVRPDRRLYYASVLSMPFGRPTVDDMLFGLGVVLARNFPARGTA
ncbi:MAG TPA: peroxiredoxin-like family protein, partial [Alphaproteobacteria bacterium]